MEREDGYNGLVKTYHLDLEVKEMEIGLMYDAIKNNEVDLISGFSTDGRIMAYDLKTLKDDKNYFPPYHAFGIVRKQIFDKYPELHQIFDNMHNLITDSSMMKMNYRVDHNKEDIKVVARDFLTRNGFKTGVERSGQPEIIIGSKAFTESFILAELIGILIENYTTLDMETQLGFGGTKLIFDAIKNNQIDIYPEYSGTALLVLLNASRNIQDSLDNNKDGVYSYVKKRLSDEYHLEATKPFGFNNTFAINIRRKMAIKYNIETISDLSELD
jgi:osmoprotectant transport system permease protein